MLGCIMKKKEGIHGGGDKGRRDERIWRLKNRWGWWEQGERIWRKKYIYIVEVIKQNTDLYLNPIRKICVMTKRNA